MCANLAVSYVQAPAPHWTVARTFTLEVPFGMQGQWPLGNDDGRDITDGIQR